MDDRDRQALVSGLGRTAERSAWRIHAYCLMDTHIHLVVETTEATLSSGMQRLLGAYAFGFNRRHGRFGHLFAGRFTSIPVDSEEHALEVCAYLVLNPVRAGIVLTPEDWPWSSYRASAGLISSPPFLERRIVPALLSDYPKRAQEVYREYVREVAVRPRPGSGLSLTPALG